MYAYAVCLIKLLFKKVTLKITLLQKKSLLSQVSREKLKNVIKLKARETYSLLIKNNC